MDHHPPSRSDSWPPSPGTTPWPSPWRGGPPSAPPVRERAGVAVAGTAWGNGSTPPPAPPAPPDPLASPQPPATPSPGDRRPAPWGWRALVAFLAGGLLVGSGFAVAELDADDVTAAGPVPTVAPTPTGPDAADPAPSTGEPVADVARRLGPAVVQIETSIGLGSGIIYSPDGYILTNNHVVTGATGVTVRLADGSRLSGQVLGSDPVVDIAVVKVEPEGELPTAELALGVPVQVGQLAVAIGSPFELSQTVTSGIVSAVNRPVPNGSGIVAMIQTDAPINPGNSGGALADREGRVIGINTSIRTETGSNAGIGFAVPIDTAMETARRIIAGEPLDQAFLGVAGQEPPGGESGVVVTEITPGSAAEAAGLQVGDRITAVDGQPVQDLLGLAAMVRSQRPGGEVTVEVVRDDQPFTVDVELGTQTRPGG